MSTSAPPGTGGPGAAPVVICLTPVLDEAWILDRFLRCAALWADHIIVADQGSTDGSREIALAHPKVRLIDNAARQFNEPERQRLLIAAAREIPGPRVLVALDADEVLTANWADSPEWRRLLRSAPGTVGYFRWVNLLPDGERCWIPDWDYPWAYVDDGAPHGGRLIHSNRVPTPPGAPSLLMREVRVLHYAATDWARMKSRQRWYQCYEVLKAHGERPAAMYRRYHHMDVPEGIRPIDPAWLRRYREQGIDVTSIVREPRYRWDRDVLELFSTHGAQRFRRIDVWSTDWAERAAEWSLDAASAPRDPRGVVDRLVFRYLARTQGRENTFFVRLADRALRALGW